MEMENRIQRVIQLLLDGYVHWQIVRETSDWKVSERQIQDYTSQALDRIKQANALTVQENLSTITTNLWTLYRAAIASKDNAEAHKVLTSIAKLRGLDKINIVLDDKRSLEKVSDDELNKMLEEG